MSEGGMIGDAIDDDEAIEEAENERSMFMLTLVI